MNQSRRSFLTHSLALAGLGSASGFALNMATMASAAAQTTTGGDYKALVCLFLNGGNDHNHTVVPYDTGSYNAYYAARNVAPDPIAIDRTKLLPLFPNTATNGRQVAFAPSLVNLKAMFEQGSVAVMANAGPLLNPLTKQEYNTNAKLVPPSLFSHNDQQSTWQTFLPEGSAAGWGGRMGDLLMAGNSTPAFTCVSLAGNSLILTGKQARQYRLSTNGAIPMSGVTASPFGASPDAFKNIIGNNRGVHLMESDYVSINNRSVNAQQLITSSLATTPAFALPAALTSSNLAAQLKMVAKMAAANSSTGAKRQVFFVGIGGFDTHDNQNVAHAALWSNIDQSLAYFYASLAAVGLQNNVTTFTASDFGRTLVSNGDGTDHAWGAHHIVVGGAVKGKDIYGTLPEIGVNTNSDVGQGRLIPTMSVEQYAYPMARWMGLSDSQVKEIFPNMARFDTPISYLT